MRRSTRLLALIPTLLLLWSCGGAEPVPTGAWEAWLDSPGGHLRFDLTVEREGEVYAAEITGGEEVLRPATSFTDGVLLLEFPHFDARIHAEFSPGAARLEGTWSKTGGHGKISSLPFHAVRQGMQPTAQERAEADIDGVARELDETGGEAPTVHGRWAVDFESNDAPSVGIFEQDELGNVKGSFLTATGDYRYLWGEIDPHGELQLQAFDGAHAFLFKAVLGSGGTLRGDFWSRDTWHESWTAVRDEKIELPDPFALTQLKEGVPLGALQYPDLDGQVRSVSDRPFLGRARIIELFGTWCPNCWDATQYLKELQAQYGDRGLAILALAFELTGDPERDTAQVKRYVETQGIQYPVLLAGTYDKEEASALFPAVDRVRAYPTFLFVDGRDRIQAIYTGFSGPATGPEHEALRRAFEGKIEELLSAAPR